MPPLRDEDFRRKSAPHSPIDDVGDDIRHGCFHSTAEISASVTGELSFFSFEFRVDRSSSPVDLKGGKIFDDFLRNGGV